MMRAVQAEDGELSIGYVYEGNLILLRVENPL